MGGRMSNTCRHQATSTLTVGRTCRRLPCTGLGATQPPQTQSETGAVKLPPIPPAALLQPWVRCRGLVAGTPFSLGWIDRGPPYPSVSAAGNVYKELS